jgi:hypothetical protein
MCAVPCDPENPFLKTPHQAPCSFRAGALYRGINRVRAGCVDAWTPASSVYAIAAQITVGVAGLVQGGGFRPFEAGTGCRQQ